MPRPAVLALLLAAAACFGLAPWAMRLDPLPGALAFLALGTALAVAASGSFEALALASGSLGAFAAAVLAPTSAAAGGAVLVGFAYAERTMRVRGGRARLAHVLAALLAGAMAGTLSAGYALTALTVRGVAVVVCAVLVALPLLVEADDPIAYALDAVAALVHEPARSSLREGAELRRTAGDDLLDRPTTRDVATTWRALVRLAEARLRLERTRVGAIAGVAAPNATSGSASAAVIGMVDGRLRDHVAALTRAYAAVDAARAARIGLDDRALRSVESTGESLEDVSRALLDVNDDGKA